MRDPSTCSSACPPEQTSRTGVSTTSPAATTTLVVPTGHVLSAHGCRPLHDVIAGYDGGGRGGGGEGGDGGGGDGGVGATARDPSTSSSACPPEQTSSVDASTCSPAATTAYVVPTRHALSAHGCTLLQDAFASGSDGRPRSVDGPSCAADG